MPPFFPSPKIEYKSTENFFPPSGNPIQYIIRSMILIFFQDIFGYFMLFPLVSVLNLIYKNLSAEPGSPNQNSSQPSPAQCMPGTAPRALCVKDLSHQSWTRFPDGETKVINDKHWNWRSAPVVWF